VDYEGECWSPESLSRFGRVTISDGLKMESFGIAAPIGDKVLLDR